MNVKNKTFSKHLVMGAILAALIVATPTSAFGDGSFQQGVQLEIISLGAPPLSGTVTIDFVPCASDPVGACGIPIAGGCGPSECSITVSCNQPNANAMALAVTNAINAAGCDG